MPRIPDSELERLKQEVSLLRLIQSQGHTLAKRGKDWAMRCIFHEDATASLVVTESKNLYHCFGCNAAGSVLDWVMKTQSVSLPHAVQILQQFGVAHEARVVSAHRMPDDLFAYAEQAAGRGLQAIIAGAGGAAHLPGMLAAKTALPVLGVPVASKHLQGVDSLHSIVQMPKGVPVATFAIGNAGAANAALFAVAMLALHDNSLADQLRAFRAEQTAAARAMTLPPL